jgi:hypothetical protein
VTRLDKDRTSAHTPRLVLELVPTVKRVAVGVQDARTHNFRRSPGDNTSSEMCDAFSYNVVKCYSYYVVKYYSYYMVKFYSYYVLMPSTPVDTALKDHLPSKGRHPREETVPAV